MDLKLNADRFTGNKFVEIYDQYRPAPPPELLKQAITYLGNTNPGLVVDIGCGTGISTIIWKDIAKQVIGVEPSDDMRRIAESKLTPDVENVKFLKAFANEISLEASSVDILTCSQAFHWMEPVSTLKEIHRLLKPGGILVIYDCMWPVSSDWQVELAFKKLFDNIQEISNTLKQTIAHRFKKKHHLENVLKSNHFRFVKEAQYHKTTPGNIDDVEGLAVSQGGLQALLKLGYTEAQMGWPEFLDTLQDRKGDFCEMTFHYKAIFGVK